MNNCVYQYVGADGSILCNKDFSKNLHYAKAIITYCNPQKECAGKKTTNADRIRAMNDKELARFIASDAYTPHCPVMVCPDEDIEDFEQCWLEWLRQETKE